MTYASKLRRPSNDRWLKLQADRRNEARYSAQRKAIADALKELGLKMLKVMGRPEFKLSDKYKTLIRYEAGQWVCSVEKYQKLIDRAIAGI